MSKQTAIDDGITDLVTWLAAAGAHVSPDQVKTWTAQQRDEAARWAHDQLHASEKTPPGHAVSVRWPDHVSAAHHAQDGHGT